MHLLPVFIFHILRASVACVKRISSFCLSFNLPRLRKMQKRDSAAEQQATLSLQSSGVAFSCCLSLLCDKSKANTSTGADLKNFMTVAHRVWLVSRRGQTKEFCVKTKMCFEHGELPFSGSFPSNMKYDPERSLCK